MSLVEENLPGVGRGESWVTINSLIIPHAMQQKSCCNQPCPSLSLFPFIPLVKKDFQVREDHVIAKQLQERECKWFDLTFLHLPVCIN